MNDYKASEKLYRFGEKHRPEKYIKDGAVDYEAWTRDYYRAFCRKFGSKPRKNENRSITEERDSLETDIYLFEKKRGRPLSLKEEREIRKRVEDAKMCRELIEEYFGKYLDKRD